MAWQNKGRTLKWLVISLVVTAGLTVVLWQVTGSPFFLGFLFLPFLFGGGRLFGARDDRSDPAATQPQCPQCGYRSLRREGPYCPRCGSRLQH